MGHKVLAESYIPENHKGGISMKTKELLGGIDVGSESHHVVVINGEGQVLYDRKIPHRFSEFHKGIREFKDIEAREGCKISFGLEGKNGYGAPFDRILGKRGFRLYNIDNLKLKQFRNIFGAEWKSDRRDARMFAKLRGQLKDVDGDGALHCKYSGPSASQCFDIFDTSTSLGIVDLAP
jgi:transposase